MKEISASFYIREYLNLKDRTLSRSIYILFLFTFLISLILTFKITLFINRELPNLAYRSKQILEKDITDIPKIEVKDGVTISPDQRYLKDWREHLLIIDPNEEDPYKILKESKSILGLTKEHLVIKRDRYAIESDIKVYDLKKIKELRIVPIDKGVNISSGEVNFDLTPEFIDRLMKIFTILSFPLILMLISLSIFLSKSLQMLFFSIFGLIFNYRLNAKLRYKQILNISIYAIIPSTLISMILQALNLKPPFNWMLYGIIYLALIYKAIEINTPSVDLNTEIDSTSD